jgi:hypothetical protein
VFIAEFIVVDYSDTRHAPATMGLTAVGFALYLIVAIAVRAAHLRLYLALPALVIPMGLVMLRTLHLRLSGRMFVVIVALSWTAQTNKEIPLKHIMIFV